MLSGRLVLLLSAPQLGLDSVISLLLLQELLVSLVVDLESLGLVLLGLEFLLQHERKCRSDVSNAQRIQLHQPVDTHVSGSLLNLLHRLQLLHGTLDGSSLDVTLLDDQLGHPLGVLLFVRADLSRDGSTGRTSSHQVSGSQFVSAVNVLSAVSLGHTTSGEGASVGKSSSSSDGRSSRNAGSVGVGSVQSTVGSRTTQGSARAGRVGLESGNRRSRGRSNSRTLLLGVLNVQPTQTLFGSRRHGPLVGKRLVGVSLLLLSVLALLLLELRLLLLLLLVLVSVGENSSGDSASGSTTGNGSIAVRGGGLLLLLLVRRLSLDQSILTVSLTFVHQLPDTRVGRRLFVRVSAAVDTGGSDTGSSDSGRDDGSGGNTGGDDRVPLALVIVRRLGSNERLPGLGTLNERLPGLGTLVEVTNDGLGGSFSSTIRVVPVKTTSGRKSDDASDVLAVTNVGRRSGGQVNVGGVTMLVPLEDGRGTVEDLLVDSRGVRDDAVPGGSLSALDVRPRRLIVERRTLGVLGVLSGMGGTLVLAIPGRFDGNAVLDTVRSVDRIPAFSDHGASGSDGLRIVGCTVYGLVVTVETLGNSRRGSRSRSDRSLGVRTGSRGDRSVLDGSGSRSDRSILVDRSRFLVMAGLSGSDGHDSSRYSGLTSGNASAGSGRGGSSRNDRRLGSPSSLGSVAPRDATPLFLFRRGHVAGKSRKDTHFVVGFGLRGLIVVRVSGCDAFGSVC